MKELHCNRCKQRKSVTEFHKQSKRSTGYQCYCKACSRKGRVRHRLTLHGYMTAALSNSKTHTKQRQNKNRSVSATTHTITVGDLKTQWNKQKGLCYYTKLPMSFVTGADWLATIERLDPNEGYTPENVVICCREMNGPTQWTHAKLRLAIEKCDEEFLGYDSQLGLETTRRAKGPSSKLDPTLDPTMERRCKVCNEIKHPDAFRLQLTGIEYYRGYRCKECDNKLQREKSKTPLGKLKQLHISGRVSSNQRDHPYDLLYEDIIEHYHNQKGRCKYTNIPMTFHGDWQVSLERLDPTLPYTKANTALICWEFNTVANFSKAKFDLIKASVCNSI